MSRSTAPASWRYRLVWVRPARQPNARVSPSRSANSPSSAAPACPAIPSPSQVTSNRGRVLVACTRKVPSFEWWMRPEQPHSSSSRRALAHQATVTADTREKPRLAIGEAVLGPDHPYIATYRSNLGVVLMYLGDLLGARVQYERALAIRTTVFGADHPATKQVADHLEQLES